MNARLLIMLGLLACGLSGQAIYKDLNPGVAVSQFGGAVSNLGDVDGDGVNDFAVGAPSAPASSADASVWVYSGRFRNLLFTRAAPALGSSNGFASELATVGDWNADGISDLAIYAPGPASNPGASFVVVVAGDDGTVLAAFPAVNAGSEFGITLAQVPDRDGDGIGELLVGAPLDDVGGMDAGAAYIISSMTGATLVNHMGMLAQVNFGSGVAACGDVDGDGTADYAIGATSSTLEEIYVYSGTTDLLIQTFNNGGTLGGLGRTIAGLGDINGDGYDDVIASLPDLILPGAQGKVIIFSGFDASTLMSYTAVNLSPFSTIGFFVANAGDYDGDGTNDYMFDISGLVFTQESSVVVFSGATHVSLDAFPAVSSTRNMRSGVPMGDLDGDGSPDFVFGDRLVSAPGGYVRVAFGNTDAIESYHSVANPGLPEALALNWINDVDFANPIQPTTGKLVASGASPFAVGLAAASFAPVDINYVGLPILISFDFPYLAVTGTIGASSGGQFTVGDLDRRYPFLAGTPIYIQFYELSPNPKASNGLRIAYLP